MVNWRFGAGWFGIRIGTPRSLIRERIKSCRSKKRLPVKSGRRSCGRKLSKNALNKKRLCLSWLSIGHQLTSPKGCISLWAWFCKMAVPTSKFLPTDKMQVQSLVSFAATFSIWEVVKKNTAKFSRNSSSMTSCISPQTRMCLTVGKNWLQNQKFCPKQISKCTSKQLGWHTMSMPFCPVRNWKNVTGHGLFLNTEQRNKRHSAKQGCQRMTLSFISGTSAWSML